MKNNFFLKTFMVIIVLMIMTLCGCINNVVDDNKKEVFVNYASLFTENGKYIGKIVMPSTVGKHNSVKATIYAIDVSSDLSQMYIQKNNLTYDAPIVISYEELAQNSDAKKIFLFGDPCNIEDNSTFIPKGYSCGEWDESSGVVYAFIHAGEAENKGIYFLWIREEKNSIGTKEHNAVDFVAGNLNVSDAGKNICLNENLKEVSCLN